MSMTSTSTATARRDARYQYLRHVTPVGELFMVGDGGALKEIQFPISRRSRTPEPGWTEGSRFLSRVAREIDQYFARDRRTFDVELAPDGTEFEQRVWAELQAIPYGETISYGELASRIGRPSAARAVGAANGKNPLPIVIPCHRVIGRNGALTGFGGGLPIKRTLLGLESRERRLFDD